MISVLSSAILTITLWFHIAIDMDSSARFLETGRKQNAGAFLPNMTTAVTSIGPVKPAYEATLQRKQEVGQSKFFVSICSRVGPRLAPYLDEWIAFHLIAGVDHFFFMVDKIADNATRSTVQAWVARGFASEITWKGPLDDPRISKGWVAPNAFMGQCYDQVAPRTEWMALIDTDEFIVPADGCSIADTIRKHCHEDLPQVVLFWTAFGTSFRKTRDVQNGLVIEDFLMSGGNCSSVCKGTDPLTYCRECRHTKAIVNTKCARTATHAHNHWVTNVHEMPLRCLESIGHNYSTIAEWKGHEHPLKASGTYKSDPHLRQCSAAFHLNHYAVLSEAEFKWRRTGGVLSPLMSSFEDNSKRLFDLRNHNVEVTPNALKFSPAVRQLLEMQVGNQELVIDLEVGELCQVPAPLGEAMKESSTDED
jgi:hypothetical protein